MEVNAPALLARYTEKTVPKWQTAGFIRLPTKILFDDRLSKSDIMVYLVLRARTFGKKTVSFPSISTISKESRYSRPKVIQSLASLESAGYLTVARAPKGSRITNRYTLRDE